jgi:hypothetical protein
MAMPDVKPYKLSRAIATDNFLTHYTATNDSGQDFIITEFVPAYAVVRAADGTIEVADRFADDFRRDLNDFITRAAGVMELRDSSLHSFVEVFERGGTAYIVRRACGMTNVVDYMDGQRMDADEAYFFMKPLFSSLVQASDCGMVFSIKPEDFRVNQFRRLILCSVPEWETSHMPQISQLARLYYRLVTGMDAPATGAPTAFRAFDAEVPPRAEATIFDAITSEGVFGSIADFVRTLRAPFEDTVDTTKVKGQGTKRAMSAAIAVLVILLAVGVAGLALGGVQAFRHNTFWADPGVFAPVEMPPAPMRDFSAMALTHPRDASLPLTGSMLYYDGNLYFRGDGGLMRRRVGEILAIPGAAAVLDVVYDHVHISDVRPAFITASGRYLFFVDAAAGSHIYRVRRDGTELERVSDNAALNLAVVGDYLFYANADANYFMYRYNIVTGEHERVLSQPIFEMRAAGHQLYFSAGTPGTANSALYVLDMNPELPQFEIRGLVSGIGHGIRVDHEGVVYYLDMEGRIRSICPIWGHLGPFGSPGVRTFDVFFHILVYLEEGRGVPRALNMMSGREFTLTDLHWASYIWVHDHEIFAIDMANPNVMHTFELPDR